MNETQALADEIARQCAEHAAARREGMKEAAQRAFEYARTAWQHGSLPVDPHECAAQVAREIAGSIAALAGVKPGEHLSEAEQERDVFFNRLGRITEALGLPMDATAQRIIEAIQERVDNEREACASVEVRLTVPKDALRRLIQHEITAALDPAVSQTAANLVATARREAMDEATQAPREIAMGHGLVDVCVCNHEGRYGLVLKPRAEYAPIGQETAPARSVVTLDGGCVVVWFDGPEFAGTIIEAIQEAAAIRAAAGQGAAQAQAAQ